MAENNEVAQAKPESGRVLKVSKQWSVIEDHAMAHKLQEDEFGVKYDWNRQDRQQARTDVPLAKVVQTEEEERLQQERYRYLEERKELAERDAAIAQQVQEEEQRKINEALGRIRSVRTVEDTILAQQFQTEEMITVEQERVRREMQDQAYAQQLQEKERKRYERKVRERDLAKQRRLLEREQETESAEVLSGQPTDADVDDQEQLAARSPRGESLTNVNHAMSRLGVRDKRVLRTDGRVEDVGDFSDFYIPATGDMNPSEQKELQELQDEELARILQDQERKRGAQINRDKLKIIETRDAELAYVMQKQERLKAKKRQSKQGPQADSAAPQPPHTRGQSQPVPPDVTQGSRDRDRGSGSTSPPYLPGKTRDPMSAYVSQNERNESVHHRQPDRGRHYNTNSNNRRTVDGRDSEEDDDYPRDDHPRGDYPRGRAESGSDSDPAGYRGRPLPGDYSPYHSRPLPERPDDIPDDPRLYAPGSPSSPPPGYRPPPAYPKKDNTHRLSGSDDGLSPPPPSNHNNVIAAIDPTFRQDSMERPALAQHPSPQGGASVGTTPPSARLPPTDMESEEEAEARENQDDLVEEKKEPAAGNHGNPSVKVAAAAATGGEDSYCDLDDIGPVQGQKRSSLPRGGQKGSKRNNCKQQ